MKQGGARAYPRYKLFLPLELQSIETISDNMTYPPLRFKTVTRNISLGGVLIELGKDMNGLKNDWKPEWFKERFFWLHIMGIPSMPDGMYTKAKVVRFVDKDENSNPLIAMEFKDLLKRVMNDLKDFLDSLSKFE